jgi:hypothetical protein
MKPYKTCKGCRALINMGNCKGYRCSLGYEFNHTELKPLQLCLKPKTIFELQQAEKMRNNRPLSKGV